MSRNPFGVQDVPDPDGEDVTAFASGAPLTGSAGDDNAEAWAGQAAATPAWPFFQSRPSRFQRLDQLPSSDALGHGSG